MLGIVSGTTNQYISRPMILAAQTLTRDECPIIEITGGENPRLWINGDVLEHAGKPWPLPSDAGDAAFASPTERADLLRRWLDLYIAPHLARVSALGVDTHVGIDFGRSANLSAVIIGTNDRSNRRAPRLIIEMEKTPWTMQDMVLDYCWPKLPRLRSGSSDCNGNGEASAERAAEQTRGKVAATRRLPETAMQRMRSDLESGALALPQHGRDLADDIASLKQEGGKITAKERTTDRKQVRHADGAYALAHFEHSIDTDGQVVPLPKRARPFTLTRRLT
jgi:phage FluMu gp28-like protein